MHLTEICEDELPHLITHVDTLIGPASDGAATPKIHDALQQRDLLPATHLVDTGFLDAALLVKSREDYGVDLLGPTRLDDHWQAREGAGFDAQHVPIDWGRQHATCPAGKTSISWTPAIDHRKHAVMKVTCSSKDCRRCDHVTPCIRSQKRDARRTLTVRPQPHYQGYVRDTCLCRARHKHVSRTYPKITMRKADRPEFFVLTGNRAEDRCSGPGLARI